MKTSEKTLLNFQADWEKVVDKATSDYALLTSAERTWFNIQVLISAVEDGGVISYYYNSGADHNKETIDDLISLGFSDIADLLIQVNKLFPNGQPSTDIDERNGIISNWEDGEYDNLFDQLDEKFYNRQEYLEQKLIIYIEENLLSN